MRKLKIGLLVMLWLACLLGGFWVGQITDFTAIETAAKTDDEPRLFLTDQERAEGEHRARHEMALRDGFHIGLAYGRGALTTGEVMKFLPHLRTDFEVLPYYTNAAWRRK